METRPEDPTRRSIGSRDDECIVMSVTRLRFTAAICQQQRHYANDTRLQLVTCGLKILVMDNNIRIVYIG